MAESIADRIRTRAKDLGVSVREVGRRAALPESTVRNILSGESESPRGATITKLAGALEVSEQWLLTGSETAAMRSEVRTAPGVRIPSRLEMPLDVPVFGTVAGSELGKGAFQLTADIVDYVRRPPGLAGARDAYALYVEGESMLPKFEPGELVYVHPHRKVVGGDYIVIQEPDTANGEPQGFIKQFVKQTARLLQTRQFNPANNIDFVIRPGLRWHKVLSSAELLGV